MNISDYNYGIDSLVGVLEDREVLDWFKDPWEVIGIHEEPRHEHKWHDQHRNQTHCQCQVWNQDRQQHPV